MIEMIDERSSNVQVDFYNQMGIFYIVRLSHYLKPRWIQALTDSRPLWHFMYSLSIALFIPRKNGIFVLWSHLRFRGHLRVPSLGGLGRQAFTGKGIGYEGDDAVDMS